MTNFEINELIFVTLGYAIFAWIYYKLAKKWVLKEKDKYIMFWKAYVYTMCVLPIGFFTLAALDYLYSALFGGVAK